MAITREDIRKWIRRADVGAAVVVDQVKGPRAQKVVKAASTVSKLFSAARTLCAEVVNKTGGPK